MRRRPIALTALAASLLASLALAACGDDKDVIKSNTTAEQLVRTLQQQRCQQKVSTVECREHGDDWECSYEGKDGNGNMILPKTGTGQVAVAC
jgi:hypothetical protein